jgi:DNA-binding CsgD family transcriptional regulator
MPKEDKFDSEIFGHCIRDKRDNTLYQNEQSKKVCGDSTLEHCSTCNDLFKDTDPLQNGIFTHKNVFLKNQQCDVVYLNDTHTKTVFFYPLKNKLSKIKLTIDPTQFTEQESHIIDLLLKGRSNTSILNELTISISTLKTHLNHIYKKEPELKTIRNSLKSI